MIITETQTIVCTGPCGKTLALNDFELTSCRGKPMRRRRCRACMKAYYRSIKKPLRLRRGETCLIAQGRAGDWLVCRVVPDERALGGKRTIPVSSHPSEQEAEAAAAQMRRGQ